MFFSKRFWSIPAVAAVALLTACGTVPNKASPNDPAGNFYQVTPTLYRGGRPDQVGVGVLEQMGIKTIIDLENDDDAVAHEAEWAKLAQLNFIHEPMNGLEKPRDRQVNEILGMIDDPALQPVYVHCMEGVDRTGLIIALHRVLSEGWTPKAAHAEMKAHGFKSILIAMDHYFKKKTNWD